MNKQQYIESVNAAKQHSYEYYVLSKPTVSDAEFDALVDRIEQAEAEHPDWTLADSPTQCVGSDLSGNGKRLVRHRTPMLSCQKAQTTEAVEKWIKQAEKKLVKMHGKDADRYFTTMWKYDGISCSLVYQDGQLISAATRGDGNNGSDLMEHVKVMHTVPKTLKCSARNYDFTGRIEVRGEIVMPKVSLSRAAGYSDCRSAASGICGKNYVTDDTRLLEFIPWAAIIDERISKQYLLRTDNQVGMRSFLGDIGFIFVTVDESYSFEGVLNYIAVASKQRDYLPYPVDGLVVRVFTDSDFYAFGFTDHHPKGSIAYKFPAQTTTSVVRRIEITVGATGRRTPVAWFDPVTILGRTVEKASLGSEDTMRKLGVTEGARVEVGLSNDVIPKIYRVVA